MKNNNQQQSPVKKQIGAIDMFLKKNQHKTQQKSQEQQQKFKTFYQQIDCFEEINIQLKPLDQFQQLLNQKSTNEKFISEFNIDKRFKQPIIQALIQNNVSYNQAQQCRRMILGNFETLKTLAYIPEDTNHPDQIDFNQLERQQKQKRIQQTCNTLLKLYEENPNNEENGFCHGLTSIYMQSRIFFGYCPGPSQLFKLSYTDQLEIEDEIDYEELTCGFEITDEQSETDDSSDDESSQLNTLQSNQIDDIDKQENEQDINNFQDVLQLFQQDDIDTDTQLLKSTSLKRQIAVFKYLQQFQKDFAYPIPVIVPETINQEKNFIVYDNKQQNKQLIKTDDAGCKYYKDKNSLRLKPVFTEKGKQNFKQLSFEEEYQLEFQEDAEFL